jgi:hypothetical protein
MGSRSRDVRILLLPSKWRLQMSAAMTGRQQAALEAAHKNSASRYRTKPKDG